jgi:hypothetical protein
VSPAVSGSAAPRVFICYRREDTAAHAGRLYDAMVNRFGERNVFMDVDLAPGVDFVERITEVVSACQVLIVVMGPNWATVEDEDGAVRIADPDDFVRLEVETALRRPEVTPIPVLVSEARMPKRETLPPQLQPLARRNALEMSNSRWGYDVDRLNDTLDELLTDLTRPGEKVAPQSVAPELATPVPAAPSPPIPAPQPPDPSPPAPARSGARLVLEGIVVAAVTAYVARWVADVIKTPNADAGAIAAVSGRRMVTWAFTGAALAVWLALRTGRTGLFRLGTIGLLAGALGGAIGGALWAVPVILHDPNLDEVRKAGSDLAAANRIQIGSLAVTGGFLGALIGWLWGRHRLGAGLAAGVAGGALIQLILNGIGWEDGSTAAKAVTFGIVAAAIAGLTLAALAALDAKRAGAPAAAPARGR